MYILVDVGGTKTRVAASRDLESFAEPVMFDTEHSYEAAFQRICGTILDLSGGERVERVAIGMPGTRGNGVQAHFIGAAHALADWSEHEIAADLEKEFGGKVVLENDVTLVGLGEAVHGAGKGADIFVYMTVSTGVNGVRIVRGAPDASRFGFEIGGQYLTMGDEPLSLERLVSGAAIAKRFGISSPKELGKDHPVWEELADTLALGVHNTILHWSPDRIAIGGSMMNEIGIPIEKVAERAKFHMKKFPTIPEIVHSQLGDVGGLWGGLVRLKQLS